MLLNMKLVFFIAFAIVISTKAVHSSKVYITRQTITLVKEIAKNNLTIEWREKFATELAKIARVSTFFAKYGGPAGELLILGLMLIDNAPQDDTKEHLKNITNQLNTISRQIGQLDAKLTHSVYKINAELKFQNFINYLISLRASKKKFESIIAGFSSNSTLLIHKLDHFIQKFYDDNYDVKLVDVLDFKIGAYNPIIDDFITLSRSYQEGNKDGNSKLPQTSTMQNIFFIYFSLFMDIMKANVILESAVNLKTAITGNNYKEDRQVNRYRNNETVRSFSGSIKKAFDKLNDNDLEVGIDFSVNGNTAQVRMINVLRRYWEYETILSSASNRSAFSCNEIRNLLYNISPCDGVMRNCLPTRKKRQPFGHLPPVRNNLTRCKCTCDKIFSENTIRKVYTGKVEAPEGFVVTGIKFVEFNKAIYPQIEVGKLLPMAMIGSPHWLDVKTDNKFYTFDFDNREMSFENSKTFKFLDAAVTGVQFENKSSGVVWTIYGRKLDFNRAILGEEYIKQSHDAAKTFDMFGKIEGLSSSTNFTVRNVTKIKFSTSSEGYDKGQSFVPYFDGNAVTMDIKAPLSGIGLIQYTNDWTYAGYIRPVLKSLDYRKYFSTSFETDDYVPANYAELMKIESEKLQKLHSKNKISKK